MPRKTAKTKIRKTLIKSRKKLSKSMVNLVLAWQEYKEINKHVSKNITEDIQKK